MLVMPLGLIANPPPRRLQTNPRHDAAVTYEGRFSDNTLLRHARDHDVDDVWNDEERFVLKTVVVFAVMSVLPLVVFLLIHWFHPEWLLIDITPSSQVL